MTRLVHTRADLEAARAGRFGDTAVVMTMGALHDGHLALVQAARQAAKTVIVTVFVNPLQFGPGEDFERYPRTLGQDVKQLEDADVDIVFAPSADEVYPDGAPQVTVQPGPMGELLEGASRPGHFSGMLTVVNKLLNLTQPDLAFYGQKDAQQLAMIRRMVRDFNLPVDIVGVRTVREPDGLALSSRNRYLSAGERQTALALSRALAEGVAKPTAAAAVRTAAQAVLDEAAHADPPLALDYLALVDPGNFHEVPDDFTGEAILLVAARIGATRLIDNTVLTIDDPVLTVPGEAK
ncbi:MAG: pantoate--beta-alanine ligase [Actinocrinis sp.]